MTPTDWADEEAATALAGLLRPLGWRAECYRYWQWDDDDGNALAVWVADGKAFASDVDDVTGEAAVLGMSTDADPTRIAATVKAWLTI